MKYNLNCTETPIECSKAVRISLSANISELMPEQSDQTVNSKARSILVDGRCPCCCKTRTK